MGIYWGPYPLLKGSNRGVKQLGALHTKGTNIQKTYGFILFDANRRNLFLTKSLNFFHVSLHTGLVVYIVIANTVFRYTILKIPQNIYILKIYLKQNNPKSIFINFSMLKKTCSFNHQHLIGQPVKPGLSYCMITGSQLQRLQMTRWHGVVQPGRGLSTITVSFRVGGINLGPLFGENGEDS